METSKWERISLICFILWCSVSLFWADSFFLAANYLAILVRSLILSGALVFLLRKGILKWRLFLWGVVGLAVLESLLGFYQVVYQGALGLYWLGEPHLNLLDPTIAKTVISGGGRLLRAYGTFPHPNVLGAFLLLGLITLLSSRGPTLSRPWRSLHSKSFAWKWFDFAHHRDCFASLAMTAGLFIMFLGLVLTFSRSAWLVGLLIAFLVFVLYTTKVLTIVNTLVNYKSVIFLIVLILLPLVIIFHWTVFPKLSFSPTEPAISLRTKYLKIGWEIFKEKPLLGVGIGNQVSYAIKNNLYQQQGIKKELDFQPVHNIYLLITNELGIIGLVLFLLFIISTFYNFIIHNSYFIIPVIALLLLGTTDHYLWDLADGQIMFWTVMFFASAYSSTDRAHPSEG